MLLPDKAPIDRLGFDESDADYEGEAEYGMGRGRRFGEI